MKGECSNTHDQVQGELRFASQDCADFYCKVNKSIVVLERTVVFTNPLGIKDGSITEQLVKEYQLEEVNSPPDMFNLSVVKEFYNNIPKEFPKSRQVVYVRGKFLTFTPNIISKVLNLLCTSDEDFGMFVQSVKSFNQHVLKSSCRLIHGCLWDFVKFNVLGTSNPVHTNVESKIILAMQKALAVPFAQIIFRSILLKRKSYRSQWYIGFPSLIYRIYFEDGVIQDKGDSFFKCPPPLQSEYIHDRINELNDNGARMKGKRKFEEFKDPLQPLIEDESPDSDSNSGTDNQIISVFECDTDDLTDDSEEVEDVPKSGND